MKQKQFKFWWGVGFGYDKSTTGGLIPGTSNTIMYVVKEYTFLCMKYGVCEQIHTKSKLDMINQIFIKKSRRLISSYQTI